ncbi:MAG: AAA family ATPase, partial [Treponema sp.]|nr:AAA family ATPase [Treponema sp.]
MISGVRGGGKTTLLAMYIDWLKRTGVDDGQIVCVSMEEPETEAILNYRGLYGYVQKRLCNDRVTYVFIDEVQKCPKYEKAIVGLLAKKQIDLYITASSATAVETAVSSLTPHIEVQVLPLSFAEYIVFSKAKIINTQSQDDTDEPKAFSDTVGNARLLQKAFPTRTNRRLPRQKEQVEKYLQQEAFNNYLSFGGFPFAATLDGDVSLIRYFVDGIYNTVLLKDVAGQAGISDIPLLEDIAKLMSKSTGRSLSSTKISAAISAKGRKISANTVETYMKALCSAFVFLHAGRFDIKTRKHLKTLGKYYIADT